MILCDTGPLVALIDRDDPEHDRCKSVLPQLPDTPLLTTWPCLTEAIYLLNRVGGQLAQNEVWSLLADNILLLHTPAEKEWQRIRDLM